MIDRPYSLPLGLLFISIAILGGAYAFQYLGGLQPCTLCLYQRWPWWVAGVLALLALFIVADRRLCRALVALSALSVLIGAGIAFYHVGVEQQWWAGPTACSGGGGTPQTLEELRAQVLGAPVVRCDEVAWSLFGISMAGYNGLISLATGFAAMALLRRNAR